MKEFTVTIFDWDDTLLPSDWLFCKGGELEPTPSHQQTKLCSLQANVVQCLSFAIHRGPVAIVTNSAQGWVEASAKRYLPAVVPLLKNVRIISARQMHSHTCGDPGSWKKSAFAILLCQICATYFPHLPERVVSIGDSNHERFALFASSTIMPHTSFISVKLVQEPSLKLLIEQLFCLRIKLYSILMSSSSQDIIFADFQGVKNKSYNTEGVVMGKRGKRKRMEGDYILDDLEPIPKLGKKSIKTGKRSIPDNDMD